MDPSSPPPSSTLARCGELFRAFLLLGCTSFGGPLAHLGWFRREFVERRAWLDAAAYAELVALCQVLPGPASSQVGMGIGLLRAGVPGACAAWLGFTLPSALLMLLFGLSSSGGTAHWLPPGVIHALKLVALAVVAQAVVTMARGLCPDWPRRLLALAVALACGLWPGLASQALACAVAGVIGWRWLGRGTSLPEVPRYSGITATGGARLLAGFAALLAVLPLAAQGSGNRWLALADGFYRAGALVFGGGHVVLPALQAETVARGWVDANAFLAGYGAAQALPGPLFSFAAFLGSQCGNPPAGWRGGLLALVAIFLPGFLLVTGSLPLWQQARRHPGIGAAMAGVNAAVVGLLLAACLRFMWPGTVGGILDALLAAAALLALLRWKLPPWALVAGAAAGGWLAGAQF